MSQALRNIGLVTELIHGRDTKVSETPNPFSKNLLQLLPKLSISYT